MISILPRRKARMRKKPKTLLSPKSQPQNPKLRSIANLDG